MKILLSILFLFSSSFSFSAGTDSYESRDSVDPNVEFHRAKKLIYNKNYKLALGMLKDIENEKPFGYSKADWYNYLGFASRKQQPPNYKEAETYYLKALDYDSNHIGALEYLGELYYETDRKDLAKTMLSKLEKVAGKNSEEYKELFELLN